MYPPADLLFELKWLFSLCVGFFALSINLCASQKKLILQLRQKYYIVIGKLLALTKVPIKLIYDIIILNIVKRLQPRVSDKKTMKQVTERDQIGRRSLKVNVRLYMLLYTQ